MDFQKIKTRMLSLDTACLCDAEKTLRVVDPAIRPVAPGFKMIGLSRTVRSSRDILAIIKALEEAERDDVLVVAGGGEKIALAGELFTAEAKRKELAGMVFDGGIRDVGSIRSTGLPVYSRWITPMAGTASELFDTQVPVVCGGVSVRAGDILFGDDDGIVVIEPEGIEAILDKAESIQATEENILKKMAKGKGLLDYLNFKEHWENTKQGRPGRLKFTD